MNAPRSPKLALAFDLRLWWDYKVVEEKMKSFEVFWFLDIEGHS